MKAVIVSKKDGPFELADVPTPAPSAGQALVKVYAAGLNPLDLKIRAQAAAHAEQPLPAILGMDVAGLIVALGDGVRGFAIGDEVYGMIGGFGGHQGALAEYVAVDARLIAPKPKNLTMRDAAALPLVSITAWEGLVDRAHVRKGQKVLVQGGGGGVGHVAIQIANAFEAEVYATDRPEKADLIRALGATPIDFTKEGPADYVARYTSGKGFDLIYDTGGGKVLAASFDAIARFGHVVSCLGREEHSLATLSLKAGTYSGVFTLLPILTGQGREHHGEIMREATRLVEAGKLRPHLDSHRFSLTTVEEAYALLGSGSSNGKIVVEVSELATKAGHHA